MKKVGSSRLISSGVFKWMLCIGLLFVVEIGFADYIDQVDSSVEKLKLTVINIIKLALAAGGIFCIFKLTSGGQDSKNYVIGLVVAVAVFAIIELVVA